MDNNLPPNPNDNQPKDDLNINPPASPPTEPEKPVVPEMPEVPETPSTPPPPPPKPSKPEENINIPEPNPNPEEPKPEEKPIEIGSLGDSSSFTSYTQEENTENSPKQNNKKGKKIKTIASVLGILLIITALPLTLLLVKQRQEIRKNAETPGPSGSVSLCGITVSPVSGTFENGTFTFRYSVTGSGKVEFHAYACACTEGNRGSCGTSSGKCNSDPQTLNAPFTRSISAPQIGDCGTYQGDVFILSVNDNPDCHTN